MEIFDAPITFGHLVTVWLLHTLMTIFGAMLSSQIKKQRESE